MGLNHSPRIVTDGLILCLDAGNTKSYPGSGTTWTDLSGNGRNSTLTNGPTFSNNNLVFDGTNDYVSIPVSSAFNFGTNSFSIDFWVRFNSFVSTTNSPTLVVFAPYYTSANNFLLYLVSGKLSIYTPTSLSETNASIAINNFYHIVLVKTSPDAISFYVNGVNTFNATKAINVSGLTAISILGDTHYNSDYSNANLSQVKIYNRALSAEEVLQNFNALRGRFGI